MLGSTDHAILEFSILEVLASPILELGTYPAICLKSLGLTLDTYSSMYHLIREFQVDAVAKPFATVISALFSSIYDCRERQDSQ